MFSTILLILFIYYVFFLKYITSFLIIFFSFLFMFLQVLFFTTCERKLLALTQRRLGPKVVGDRGRLQYFADALKLITKSYTSPRKINSLFFSGAAVAAFWFSWYSFTNLSFNYGNDIMEIEYNIFFLISCSLAFSIAWLVAGWSSVSKYALLGCIRSAVQIISYEILMSGIFLIIFFLTGTINFEIFMDIQLKCSLFFFIPVIALICFLSALMETNRPPFDLSEAESDVVAGYTVEYGGILFGLFYLGEYIHLFTNSFIIVIIFSGGWWNIFLQIKFFFFWLLNFLFFYKIIFFINLSLNFEHWIFFFKEYNIYDYNFFFLDIYIFEYFLII